VIAIMWCVQVDDQQLTQSNSLHKPVLPVSAATEQLSDSSTRPAAATVEQEQQAKRTADLPQVAAGAPAPAAPLQELVKRTDSAISDAAAVEVLKVEFDVHTIS
jgi:hypothetical protein